MKIIAKTTLINPLQSADTTDAVRACKILGAKIAVNKNSLSIESRGTPLTISKSINTGNSGITTRFLLPVMGLVKSRKPIQFDCGEQMKTRPLSPLIQAITKLGLTVKHTKGHCPLQISGALLGGRTNISRLSSQYLSALLLSLPLAERDSEIRVSNLHERPYVSMTETWLKDLKISY